MVISQFHCFDVGSSVKDLTIVTIPTLDSLIKYNDELIELNNKILSNFINNYESNKITDFLNFYENIQYSEPKDSCIFNNQWLINAINYNKQVIVNNFKNYLSIIPNENNKKIPQKCNFLLNFLLKYNKNDNNCTILKSLMDKKYEVDHKTEKLSIPNPQETNNKVLLDYINYIIINQNSFFDKNLINEYNNQYINDQLIKFNHTFIEIVLTKPLIKLFFNGKIPLTLPLKKYYVLMNCINGYTK